MGRYSEVYIILLKLCDGLFVAIVKNRGRCYATFAVLKTGNYQQLFRRQADIDKNAQKILNPVNIGYC
jgi:hypothetical protein